MRCPFALIEDSILYPNRQRAIETMDLGPKAVLPIWCFRDKSQKYRAPDKMAYEA